MKTRFAPSSGLTSNSKPISRQTVLISVQSVNGSDTTIVDGRLSVQCFYLGHSNALVD